MDGLDLDGIVYQMGLAVIAAIGRWVGRRLGCGDGSAVRSGLESYVGGRTGTAVGPRFHLRRCLEIFLAETARTASTSARRSNTRRLSIVLFGIS